MLCRFATAANIEFTKLAPEVIRARIGRYGGDNATREVTLKQLFAESGCAADQLSELPIKREKLPNIACVLKGATDSVIVVGAHFDRVDNSTGIIDNWSGASLLPSLLQSLKSEQRQHTFVFIGFNAEERGEIGSEAYVKQLTKEERARIRAMVNMDTLGLSPTKIWVSHSDDELVKAIETVAASMKLPLSGMNVERVGTTDSEVFRAKKIPAITIHSLTQATLGVLHNPKDNPAALQFNDYYDSYALIAGYLAYLDGTLPTSQPGDANPANLPATSQ